MDLNEVCTELQKVQKKRATIIKSRQMVVNRLEAIVAGTLGYHNNMGEDERKDVFKKARAKIEQIIRGEETDCPYEDVVRATQIGVDAFKREQKKLESSMEKLAKQLPKKVVAWSHGIRGFGKTSQLFLAIVIGETGNLNNYPNPQKLWKRLAVAPYSGRNGKTFMGRTWRLGKEGKLEADEWSAYGYSPRRRAISYLIGVNIVKQNDGVYQERYRSIKESFQEAHPDYKKMHCHLHAMLLATKRLYLDLWRVWHGQPPVAKMGVTSRRTLAEVES